MINENIVKNLSIYEQGHELNYGDIYKIKNEHARNKAFKKYSDIVFNASVPIKPNRYVWHLSPTENRENIFEKGIIPGPKSNLVFVNNQIERPGFLWPILGDDGFGGFLQRNFEDFDGFIDEKEEDNWIKKYHEEVYSYYDFWRVDSNIAGYDGYRIDPFKPADGYLDNAKWDSAFLARNKSIPSTALTLFRYLKFSMPEYFSFFYKEIKEFVYYKSNGVIRTSRFDKANPCFLEEYKPLSKKIAA
jgi:hypothetical protein